MISEDETECLKGILNPTELYTFYNQESPNKLPPLIVCNDKLIEQNKLIENHIMDDRNVILTEGEMIVVPKGVEHKPCANQECKILVIEPRGVINTGDKINELTINEDMWI